jgi:hypothetical protein
MIELFCCICGFSWGRDCARCDLPLCDNCARSNYGYCNDCVISGAVESDIRQKVTHASGITLCQADIDGALAVVQMPVIRLKAGEHRGQN